MVDQDDLIGAEETLRNHKAAKCVLGGDSSSIADHVGVAFLQAECLSRIQSRVHAGKDRHLLGRWQRQVAFVEP